LGERGCSEGELLEDRGDITALDFAESVRGSGVVFRLFDFLMLGIRLFKVLTPWKTPNGPNTFVSLPWIFGE
jgi:hypothetical protein